MESPEEAEPQVVTQQQRKKFFGKFSKTNGEEVKIFFA